MLFLAELLMACFYFIYIFARVVWINRKVKGKVLWKGRKVPVNDLCWLDTLYGIIKVFYKKEEQLEFYVTSACGVKEFCSIVEEVGWTEPED